MRSRLVSSMTVMSMMGSSLPAHADSLFDRLLYPSAASGGSGSWKHILVISLTVVGFVLVVFFALGLPAMHQVMRDSESEARADPLYQRIRRSLSKGRRQGKIDRQNDKARGRDLS